MTWRSVLFLLALGLGIGACNRTQQAALDVSDEGTEQSPVLGDRELHDRIIVKLYSDRSFSPRNVQVNVDQGVVTLLGLLPTLEAKQRAIETVQATPGVRGVVDLVQLPLEPVLDSVLFEELAAALDSDPRVERGRIQIEVRNGRVLLSGVLRTWSERFLVERLAQGIPGVKRLENGLRIEELPLDRNAEEALRRRLAADPMIVSFPIDISLRGSEATLSGTVPSVTEKIRAQLAAGSVPGVMHVDASGLVIREPSIEQLAGVQGESSDGVLKRNIQDALLADPRLGSDEISISVQEGIVLLSGSVATEQQKRRSAATVRNTPGVRDVVNLLDVGRGSLAGVAASDEAIHAAVVRVLSAEALFAGNPIEVAVRGAVVRLSGTVDDERERELAGRLAGGVAGVLEVMNELEADRSMSEYSDELLLVRIESALETNAALTNPGAVVVDVTNGSVTLSGVLENIVEQRAAIQTAFQAGANKVMNQTKVLEGPSLEGRVYEAPPVPMGGRKGP